jgi:hypothetical protein
VSLLLRIRFAGGAGHRRKTLAHLCTIVWRKRAEGGDQERLTMQLFGGISVADPLAEP